jgi:hypothetical protein
MAAQARLLFSLEKNKEGRLTVEANEDTLKFFATKLKRRLSIICIAGLYRTGSTYTCAKHAQKASFGVEACSYIYIYMLNCV